VTRRKNIFSLIQLFFFQRGRRSVLSHIQIATTGHGVNDSHNRWAACLPENRYRLRTYIRYRKLEWHADLQLWKCPIMS